MCSAARDDDLVEERLQRHGHAGLQRDGADRQAEARELRHQRARARHRLHRLVAIDRASVGLDALEAAVLDEDARDLGMGMYLHAPHHGALGIAPGDGVVAGDGAGRVIERAEHGIAHILRQVHRRAQAAYLVGEDQLGIDAQMLVDLGAPAAGADGGVGVGQGEMAAFGIEDVVAEVVAEVLVEGERLVVEAHALRRQVVRADDRRVARGIAAGEVALLDHGDVGDAVVARQVVGRGHAVAAAADDDDVVAALEFLRPRKVALGRVAPAQTIFQKSERHAAGKSRVDGPADPNRGFPAVQDFFPQCSRVSG